MNTRTLLWDIVHNIPEFPTNISALMFPNKPCMELDSYLLVQPLYELLSKFCWKDKCQGKGKKLGHVRFHSFISLHPNHGKKMIKNSNKGLQPLCILFCIVTSVHAQTHQLYLICHPSMPHQTVKQMVFTYYLCSNSDAILECIGVKFYFQVVSICIGKVLYDEG